jgi:hypothetical protein
MKTRLLLVLLLAFPALAEDIALLCADRAAIERVYYNHRLGEKPPFEQVSPPSLIDRLVRQELRKESALKKAYGVEITPAMLEAEAQRINTTTRAPDVLAELKAALGNDPARFARTVARPIVVERELRSRFDNDDHLHTPQRRQVEQARNELLAARSQGAGAEKLVALLKRGHSNEVNEVTWELAARPPEQETANPDAAEIQKRFGPNAQILASPQSGGGKERKFYFEDLSPELQKVLRAQLRQPADVSAVIETPNSFLLYVTKEKTGAILSVAGLNLPKRSYEQWLEEAAK